MTVPEQLQLLLDLIGDTQSALASKLDVSFVTLNRWIRGKARPRAAAIRRIERLIHSYTGEVSGATEPLAAKKAVVLALTGKRGTLVRSILDRKDLLDEFVLRLTFTSNRIEGSTMTEAETAIVLFQNQTVPRRSLVEQLEAKNHQAALLSLFRHLAEEKPIDEALLLSLHGILMNGIRDDAGMYRRHGVRIVGAQVATANYAKVPELMGQLMPSAQTRAADPIEHAAVFHARFEQIHPFSDGNGRIGRLLLHAMLLRSNLPPAIIRPELRRGYYAALHEAQRHGDSALLQEILCNGVLAGHRLMQGH